MNNSSEHYLLEELKQLFSNFNCTLQDLRNPTEEFVTSFYTFWLSEFEVNITTIPQAQFSQLQISNVSVYNDSYSSTVPKLNLLLAIRSFNVVPDFGILDIVSPTPKRIQSVIRAFIEFYLWCDNRIGSMIDLKKSKKISERKQLLAGLLQEKQNLQQQFNNVLKEIGQLQDAIKKLEEKSVKYQQEASELRLQKDMLKALSDEASEKIKEKDAIIHKLAKEDSQITNKIKDCSNQIVNSPTLILTDLDTLKAKDKEMKALSDQKRDLVESKMKAQKNLEEVLSSVEEKGKQLDELLKLIEDQRKVLHVVSDIEKTTAGCQEELKQLKSALMSLMSKKSNRQEELQAFNLKWKTMKDQLTKSVEAAKNELNDQKNAKNKMITGLKEKAAVEEEIDSILEKMKAHWKALEDAIEKTLYQENVHFERLKTKGLSRAQEVYVKAGKNKKKSKK